ncbi:MAG: HAD family phosphatase [Clostridia bacterium]|nr:HAD family phosphatase [Clostridia bacterium]
MPNQPIRLIATDMDGTLLDDKNTIPERNLRAIYAAREKGIVFAIASGRFPENAYLKLADFGLRCPIIASNGARIVDENLHTLREIRMDPQAAKETAESLLALGNDFFIFAKRMVCVSNEHRLHHSEVSHGEEIRALGVVYYRGREGVKRVVGDHVHKFFVCDNQPLEPVRQALCRIHGIDLTQSSFNNIEVMPSGVDKGRGVRDLAKLLGIPMSQVMALGDEENDVPMLSAAGYGVAMKNASDAAKSAARYITDSNGDCGFAKAIEEYAL